MDNKCFVKTLQVDIGETEEYLFGVKLFFYKGFPDGNVTLYYKGSKNIDNFQCNVPLVHKNNSVTIQCDNSKDTVFIIKDARSIAIQGLQLSNGTQPNRFTNEINTNIYTMLSDEEAISNLNYLSLNGSKAVGDLVNLAGLVNLTTLNLTRNGKDSQITGSIEDFAKAQIANGRTNGTLSILCNGSITYNNTPVNSGEKKTITYSDGDYSVS